MNKITIIGIGKLGLCNALCLEKCGYNVMGIDINLEYVFQLNNKIFKSQEPYVNEYLTKSKNFIASTSLDEGLEFSDIIYICIQTPNGGNDKFYDHSHLSNLLSNINKKKIKNKNFIISCTVMPGYINTIAKKLLEDCYNCTVNYNPEFVAQGNIIKGYEYQDIILIGEDNINIGNIIEQIQIKLCKNNPTVCRMKPMEAEITKISINGFVTTKIAYANLIFDSCNNVNANPNIVLNAIGHDTRIGNKYFNPGNSYGGPCFPRDTKALAQFINNIGLDPLIPISTDKQNYLHIKYQANELLKQNLNQYEIRDVCYKNNCQVPIIEESAKLKIAKILIDNNKKVIIIDKKPIIDEVKKEFGNIFSYQII